jgi:hypothetical protein
LGKFDYKIDVGIFLGYSTISRASRVYNTRTKVVREFVNVIIDDESTTDHNKEEQAELHETQTSISEFILDIPDNTGSTTSEDIRDTPQVEKASDTSLSPNPDIIVKKPHLGLS